MNKLGKISFEFMRLHNLTSIYYTTERDTHFYNYTENLHLAWQINLVISKKKLNPGPPYRMGHTFLKRT